MNLKARIEYEITPIRNIAVQCPDCKNWFDAREITEDHIHDLVDVENAEYRCPKCDRCFGREDFEKNDIVEVQSCDSYEEVFVGVKRKKVSWE